MVRVPFLARVVASFLLLSCARRPAMSLKYVYVYPLAPPDLLVTWDEYDECEQARRKVQAYCDGYGSLRALEEAEGLLKGMTERQIMMRYETPEDRAWRELREEREESLYLAGKALEECRQKELETEEMRKAWAAAVEKKKAAEVQSVAKRARDVQDNVEQLESKRGRVIQDDTKQLETKRACEDQNDATQLETKRACEIQDDAKHVDTTRACEDQADAKQLETKRATKRATQGEVICLKDWV